MRYLLDTNLFITFVRRRQFTDFINTKYRKKGNILFTSCVVEGELKSFAMQRNWGFNKIERMQKILSGFTIYPIKTNKIIEKYAEIDAFSQGKHPTIPLNTSARNMGKNDLCLPRNLGGIAATASVLDATLITMDKDFDHLNEVFLDVICIDLNKIT
jgi:tRNA(fMet)-specific endonuclease VapC